MFLNLIATFSIGFCAAGIVLLLNKLSGKRLPGWLMPVAAGAAMFGYQMWNEYTWFERTEAALPNGVAVAQSYLYSNPIQPWTLLVPRVNRFVAVDVAGAQRNANAPDYALARLFLFERFTPTASRLAVFDCARPRRAPYDAGEEVTADGLPAESEWVAVAADDPVRAKACG